MLTWCALWSLCRMPSALCTSMSKSCWVTVALAKCKNRSWKKRTCVNWIEKGEIQCDNWNVHMLIMRFIQNLNVQVQVEIVFQEKKTKFSNKQKWSSFSQPFNMNMNMSWITLYKCQPWMGKSFNGWWNE